MKIWRHNRRGCCCFVAKGNQTGRGDQPGPNNCGSGWCWRSESQLPNIFLPAFSGWRPLLGARVAEAAKPGSLQGPSWDAKAGTIRPNVETTFAEMNKVASWRSFFADRPLPCWPLCRRKGRMVGGAQRMTSTRTGALCTFSLDQEYFLQRKSSHTPPCRSPREREVSCSSSRVSGLAMASYLGLAHSIGASWAQGLRSGSRTVLNPESHRPETLGVGDTRNG